MGVGKQPPSRPAAPSRTGPTVGAKGSDLATKVREGKKASSIHKFVTSADSIHPDHRYCVGRFSCAEKWRAFFGLQAEGKLPSSGLTLLPATFSSWLL